VPLNDNDETRMTRQQLADRIRQMEITAERNGLVGAPNNRHRPMEDRKRREKIARYQEELERRDRADAAQAAADAREAAKDTCDCRFDGDTADASECAAHGASKPMERYSYTDQEQQYRDEQHEAREEREYRANVANDGKPEPARRPCPPLRGLSHPCRTCGAQAGTPCPPRPRLEPAAKPEYTEYPLPPAEAVASAQAATDARRATVAAIRGNTILGPVTVHTTGAQLAAALATASTITTHTSGPVVHPPQHPALAVPCPACSSKPGESCTNYKGVRCHPHGDRSRVARAAGIETHPQPAPRPEPTPAADRAQEPAAIAHAPATQTPTPAITEAKCTVAEKCSQLFADGQQCSKNASTTDSHGMPCCKQHARERRDREDAIAGKSKVPARSGPIASHTDPTPELVTAMRKLLKTYTSGQIIDAAWDVSAAMFRERLKAADTQARNGSRQTA
jgi:hypothetical protein